MSISLLHPRTVTVGPEYSGLKDFIVSLPDRFDRGEGTLVYRGRNELRLFEHGGYRLVVKAFRRPNLINRLVYGLLRPSKAKRAYENALLLRRIGVGTPAPVGYLNRRMGLLFDRSYLVTMVADCPHVYQELFEREFDCTEQVLREVGRVTARLHEHGLAHKDYGRGNILFDVRPDGVHLELVDLNRMYRGPLDIRRGCKNLERLPATPEMHRWLAEEYARARGFDADECFRLMQAFRSTQPGKIDGKY
jgi:hypothetical protein